MRNFVKILKTAMKKVKTGEYLAPQVGVIELMAQSLLCMSDLVIDSFEDGGIW